MSHKVQILRWDRKCREWEGKSCRTEGTTFYSEKLISIKVCFLRVNLPSRFEKIDFSLLNKDVKVQFCIG